MHLDFGSIGVNDKNTLEGQAEVKLLASIEYIECEEALELQIQASEKGAFLWC